MIVKIQECEAVLAAASDKGQQIAADGSAADRNSVTETLTSLKQQLQGLRRAVERQREALEKSAATHAQMADTLDGLLDRGHALEVQVQGRPLLLRTLESVEAELVKHKVSICGGLSPFPKHEVYGEITSVFGKTKYY